MTYHGAIPDNSAELSNLRQDTETSEIAHKLGTDFTSVGKSNFADLLSAIKSGKAEDGDMQIPGQGNQKFPDLMLIDFKGSENDKAPPGMRKGLETQKIERLIDKLGSDSYLIRHRAHKKLEQMGTKAIPCLINGLKNKDLEIRSRCRQLFIGYLQPSVRSIEDIRAQSTDESESSSVLHIDRMKSSLQARLDQLHDHLKNPRIRDQRVETINQLLKATEKGRLFLSPKEVKSLTEEKDFLKSPEVIYKAMAITLVELADLSGDDARMQKQCLLDAMKLDPRVVEQKSFQFVVQYTDIGKDPEFGKQFKNGSSFMKRFKAAGGSTDSIRQIQKLSALVQEVNSKPK